LKIYIDHPSKPIHTGPFYTLDKRKCFDVC